MKLPNGRGLIRTILTLMLCALGATVHAGPQLEVFAQTCARHNDCEIVHSTRTSGELFEGWDRRFEPDDGASPPGEGGDPFMPPPFPPPDPSPVREGTYDGSVRARAAFGELGTLARVTLSEYPAGSYEPSPSEAGYGGPEAAAMAWARFTDTLTVSASKTGDAFMRMTVEVDRTITPRDPFRPDGAWANLTLFRYTGPTPGSGFVGDGRLFSDSGSTTETLAIPVVLGQAFEFSLELQSLIRLYDAPDSEQGDFPDYYDYSGAADLAHTARVASLQFFADREFSQALEGVSVIAGSGARYTVGSSVPAPAAGLLIGFGAILMGWVRRCSGLHQHGIDRAPAVPGSS